MRWRRLLIAVPAVLLAAQVVPVPRTNPPVERQVPAPPEVMGLLRRACFDCHSHETVWGWHTRIAPVSWLAAWDVHEGRDELNFSRWGQGKHAARAGQKIAKELREGDMPPLLYVLAHPAAKLSEAEQAVLTRWAEGLPPGPQAAGGREGERHGREHDDD